MSILHCNVEEPLCGLLKRAATEGRPYKERRGEIRLNQKGFSLIEVLLALVILAIGILAIAGMQITSMRGNFFSDNIMQASILGQDRLEHLRSLTLDATTFSLGTHDDGFIAIRGTTFTRTYVVEQHPNASLTDSRVIRVFVRWRDTSDHSISFSTVKSP
jgi:type IV pilus modification protein PilV